MATIHRPVPHEPRPWLHALTARCSGPGGFYNMGNALGLGSGLALALASAEAGGGLAAILGYLAGSPGASALTLAMVLFFVSGEAYHRAYAGPDAPDPAAIRLGDALSGVAALVLAVALALFGDATLALVSTALLAGGKFGNAIRPEGWPVRLRGGRADLFRLAPLASRIPAMLGLTAGLAAGPSTLEPAILLVCYLMWAWADVLLLRR